MGPTANSSPFVRWSTHNVVYFASTEIPIRSDQERLWCCSQPPAASLEGKLFALTGFTLHQEPAGETHPQLPKPAANSTLRTANSSSKAQPVKKKNNGDQWWDWPLPRLLHQGLPARSCVDRTSSVFGSVSRGGGAAACSLTCARRWVRHRFGPEESRVTRSDRFICLRQTDGQAPAPSVSTVTSCHQRSGRALTDKQRARPVTLSYSWHCRPLPPTLISLHPGIEWPYKNVQRERQIQKLEKHYPDGGPLTPSPQAPPYLTPAPTPSRAENLWAVSPVFLRWWKSLANISTRAQLHP